MKCPSCQGSGSAYLDVDSKKYGEISIHEHCGECAGTGLGEVAEAAAEIHYALRWHSARDGDTPAGSARKRRETIARIVASAVLARERS